MHQCRNSHILTSLGNWRYYPKYQHTDTITFPEKKGFDLFVLKHFPHHALQKNTTLHLSVHATAGPHCFGNFSFFTAPLSEYLHTLYTTTTTQKKAITVGETIKRMSGDKMSYGVKSYGFIMGWPLDLWLGNHFVAKWEIWLFSNFRATWGKDLF